MKTEELDKTDNDLIFIEKDKPLLREEISKKLKLLQNACETENDDLVRDVLRKVVPTFRKPEKVNQMVKESEEMKNQRKEAVV